MSEVTALLVEQRRNLLFAHILENRIYRSLEKPLKLSEYDRIGDPDEHIEHINNRVNYYHVEGPVKCKLFALTLIGATRKW